MTALRKLEISFIHSMYIDNGPHNTKTRQNMLHIPSITLVPWKSQLK
jgi:hypothetical protein